MNLNCGRSDACCPDWIKSIKATKNPISNYDNKCFQCAMKVAWKKN